MSIEIKLFNFGKKVNSTAIPSGGVSYSCNIKAPCSIISPTVEIVSSDSSWITDRNYAYIPDFNRYYYIDDIIYERGIWTLSLNVDVLATYKSTIGSTSMYILRSSTAYDTILTDTLYPMSPEATVYQTKKSLGYGWDGSFASGQYVLGVQGIDNQTTSGILYYLLTPTKFVDVISNFYANTGTSWWGNLASGVKNSLNKIDDFIVSCRWYPDSISFTTGSDVNVYIGSYDTGVDAPQITDLLQTTVTGLSLPTDHPQISRGEYMNYSPFASYEIRNDLIGTVSLDPVIFNYWKDEDNGGYYVKYSIDVTDGSMRLAFGYTYNNTRYDLFTQFVKFGVDIDLTGTSVDITGAISGALTAASGIISGGTTGILTAAAGIGQATMSATGSPNSKAGAGSVTALVDDNLYITAYYHLAAGADNANHGRPYCQMNTPASLGGYMECDNPHIKGSGMTQGEARMINSYLSSGFYYE